MFFAKQILIHSPMIDLSNQVPEFCNPEEAAELLDDIISQLEIFELDDQISTLRGFLDTIQERLADVEQQEQEELGLIDE